MGICLRLLGLSQGPKCVSTQAFEERLASMDEPRDMDTPRQDWG